VLHELQKGYRVGERCFVRPWSWSQKRAASPVEPVTTSPKDESAVGGVDIDVSGARRDRRQDLMSRIIGIDLGTTNSCVRAGGWSPWSSHSEGSRTTPS